MIKTNLPAVIQNKNMNKWDIPSLAANRQGVCHTEEECVLMYADINQDRKQVAINWILEKYARSMSAIADACLADPINWFAPYHMGWGMAFRNNLRKNNMGENYFNVHNLDCIQTLLLEDCITKWNLTR